MKRFWILGIAALALTLMGVAPALAAEAPAAEVAPKAEAVLDLNLAEEPNMTPAEKPEAPDLLGLVEGQRIERLRICDLDQPPPCPPGCFCIEIAGQIQCHC